ncbi:3655_t:CDS:2 [Funneliformis mosseae]|uniref:3655_t:CDS:1 n=1 Tax=Funneliformis mosseae TaxID=27381 RepID=A0A9N8WCI2_FUNMO|nr:3655_t:CDS:2 [Funneliformis mosseae]
MSACSKVTTIVVSSVKTSLPFSLLSRRGSTFIITGVSLLSLLC